MRGYFGIGIDNGKTPVNLGTLWRSAHILGADFIYTIGARYKMQSSDTTKAWRTIPLFNYETFEDFYKHMPKDCLLVGVELDPKAIMVNQFVHPERCIYLLGAEDNGLSQKVIDKCHAIVQLPGDYCMNVAVAGSLIMYDRNLKGTGGMNIRANQSTYAHQHIQI